MIPTLADVILGVLGPYLQHDTQRNRALQPHEQLLTALRYVSCMHFIFNYPKTELAEPK